MAGLVFSILGWFTFGLLCIPGAFLSFLGLFNRGPKGAAIAGLIVGFPGVLFFMFVGVGLLLGVLGVGAAVNEARQAAGQAAANKPTPIVQIGMEDNDGLQYGGCVTLPIMTFDCLCRLNKIIYHPSYVHLYSDAELFNNLAEMGLLRDVRTMPVVFEHRHWAG